MRHTDHEKALIVGLWSVASAFVGVGLFGYAIGSLFDCGALVASVFLSTFGSLGMAGSAKKLQAIQGRRSRDDVR